MVIEAHQLNHENLKVIWEWMGDAYEGHANVGDDQMLFLDIKTLEGTMTADEGDWIIKGINGEFYPCKPDIFDKTYEAA
ncbi:MAG: hypothetical protein ACPGES_03760 [Coraliomargarita sp.]